MKVQKYSGHALAKAKVSTIIVWERSCSNKKKLKNKNSVLRQIHNLSLGRFVELKVELNGSPRCEPIALRSSELFGAA